MPSIPPTVEVETDFGKVTLQASRDNFGNMVISRGTPVEMNGAVVGVTSSRTVIPAEPTRIDVGIDPARDDWTSVVTLGTGREVGRTVAYNWEGERHEVPAPVRTVRLQISERIAVHKAQQPAPKSAIDRLLEDDDLVSD